MQDIGLTSTRLRTNCNLIIAIHTARTDGHCLIFVCLVVCDYWQFSASFWQWAIVFQLVRFKTIQRHAV